MNFADRCNILRETCAKILRARKLKWEAGICLEVLERTEYKIGNPCVLIKNLARANGEPISDWNPYLDPEGKFTRKRVKYLIEIITSNNKKLKKYGF